MPKIAFLFPGQGAQALGMGRELCEKLPSARRLFDEAQAILGYSLLEVCTSGPVDRLNSTVVSQPAIFVASLAALESLKQSEPGVVDACTATAGLSLGEYTALVFAGAFEFTEALKVVKCRGEAMQAAAEATPSAMTSIIGLEPERIEELCAAARSHGTIQIANRLAPGNIVVSGTREACGEVERLVAETGGRTIRLAVAGAFHTGIMKPADEKLAAALETVTIKQPRVPVWSNVDARPHSDPAEIRRLLVRQVLQPVLWEETMRGLLADGYERFYEIGPGRVLAGLLKRVLRKAECVNISA
jgi:[acyl-carrier-protein] S-malonyltransferase